MAGQLLKRFNSIMDYKKAKSLLKRTVILRICLSTIKAGLYCNRMALGWSRKEAETHKIKAQEQDELSRLSVAYKCVVEPAFKTVELRPDSPTEKAGLKLGDIVLVINNREVHHLSLQEVNTFFRTKDGKPIKLLIDRDGVIMKFHFKLEKQCNKKAPKKGAFKFL